MGGLTFILSVALNVWVFFKSFYLSIRNIAKMEDAKVEIDDGRDESVLPDTAYQ